MARPTTLTKEAIDDLAENMALGVPLDTAARAAGIPPRSFYRYKRDAAAVFKGQTDTTAAFTPEYLELLEYFIEKTTKADAEAEIVHIKNLKKASDQLNVGASKFMLKARWGWRDEETQEQFQRRRSVELGEQAEIEYSKLPTSELEKLVASIDVVEGEVVDDDEDENDDDIDWEYGEE